MSLVLISAACDSRAEQTLLGVLGEDEGNGHNFLPDFERDVGIVPLGGDVLVEGLGGGELLPEWAEEYLHWLHWNLLLASILMSWSFVENCWSVTGGSLTILRLML